jgi:hypothetical protein
MLRGTLMTIAVLLFLSLALIAQAVWGWGVAGIVAAVGLVLYVSVEVVPNHRSR